MRKIVLLAWILLSALGMLGAEGWTVLVYMAADNNLSQYGREDINSMESIAQPDSLSIIVQADFSDGAKRYRIEQDSSFDITSPVLSDLGHTDSGDFNTLKDFINWGYAAYPSRRKMLVIWSHGNSWYKGNESKWICSDESSNSSINVYNGELAQAFSGTPKLDILLFDACSMQGVEVLGEVYQAAEYVIGSADLVPANGFPYETMLPLLDGDITDVLTQIPTLYTESYLPGMGINPGPSIWTTTCSTIATAQYPQLMDKFRELVEVYWEQEPDLMGLRIQCFEMNDGLADVDMRDFFFRLRNAGYGSMSISAGELADIWDDMVYSSASTDAGNTPHIGSGALWFPDYRLNFAWGWQRYNRLNFTQTGWLGLINHALGDDVPPVSPPLLSYSADENFLHLSLAGIADPDPIRYELVLTENNQSRTMMFTPDNGNESYQIHSPISAFGSFRLVAIDRNGNRSGEVTGEYSYYLLRIYPNPVRGRQLANVSWLAAEGASGEAKLELYNIRGQRMFSRKLGTANFGAGSYPLFADEEFKSLSAGRYVLRMSLGSVTLTKKLIIVY